MKTVYIIFTLLLVSYGSIMAQEMPQDYKGYNVEDAYKKQFVMTPEVASLFQKAAYPVNYSTGTVDIKIPLYEVRCGDLVVPIYLAYNTAGIKVNDPVSWVGQNWTLHAEPYKSLIRHGHDDSETAYDPGRTYSYETVSQLVCNDFYEDFLPDEWLYSLPNKSGKYIYSPSGHKNITFPHDDVKISMNEIVDVDGTRYIFSGGYDLQRFPNGITTCKRASEMIAPNGVDTIHFSYDNNRNVTVKHIVDNIIVLDNCHRSIYDPVYIPQGERAEGRYFRTGFYSTPERAFFHPIVYKTKNGVTSSHQVTFGQYDSSNNNVLYSDGRPNSGNGIYGSLITTSIESQQLSRITGSYCTVNFVMGSESNGKNLERIEIIDNITSDTIKTIEFAYQRPLYRKRSFLTSITVYNKDRSIHETTSFSYEAFSSLPDPGTRSFDMWGYYNDSIVNDDISVPQMTLSVIKDLAVPINGNNWQDDSLTIGSPYKRGADEGSMKMGMLKKITYPTGASDEFVFEANRAAISQDSYHLPSASEFHIVNQLTMVCNGVYKLGGLRIKEITTKYEGNELKCRSFSYGANNCGYGETRIVDGFNYFMRSQQKCYNHLETSGGYAFLPDQVNLNNYTRSRMRTISSTPIIPITYPNGAAVMYGKVTEYNGTATDNVGITEYTFNVRTKRPVTDGYHVFSEEYDTDYDQGVLLNKKVYEKDANSSYSLKSEDVYSYTKKEYSDDIIQGCEFFITAFGDYDPTYVLGRYTKNAFSFHSSIALQTAHSHYEYEGGNCRAVHTHNTYEDDNTNLQTTLTCSNADQTVTERYFYPKDSANVYPYNEMLSRNIISPVIRTVTSGNGMYLCQNAGFEAFTNRRNEKFYEPTSLSKQYSESGPSETRISRKYDRNANLVQQTEAGISTTYIWGYKGEYPIASISNFNYSQLTSIIPEAMLAEICNAEQPSSYHWTLIERIRTKIKNGELKAASMTTYTYAPLLGMTSQTDTKGLTVEYEYDSFGRLAREYLKQPDGNRQLLKQYEYKYASQM